MLVVAENTHPRADIILIEVTLSGTTFPKSTVDPDLDHSSHRVLYVATRLSDSRLFSRVHTYKGWAEYWAGIPYSLSFAFVKVMMLFYLVARTIRLVPRLSGGGRVCL